MTTAIPTAIPEAISEAISDHARPADVLARRAFGPRVRRLHARIGAAHHQAEGMTFSRSLLEGHASPRQLAALIRALAPAYELIEEQGPELAAALGAKAFPWTVLARRQALRQDVAMLGAIPATPASAAAHDWLDQLRDLARQAPHRLMAHVYVRYGGDLSGGQQLGEKAQAILSSQGLPSLRFWKFQRPIPELKQALHDAFEQLDLSEVEEEELLEEAVVAFRATQRLLAELAALETPAPASSEA
ncbi:MULTISPECIES: biliverdin-producing heme oxygenase [unclassified Cyanobium]|uniref:biliverdin-producing heme oxygenase n=1 Tax=unclassified Cyanobium TaxID=2627006 RepID=UPI0020CD21B4|nr:MULTISPECIES: biliverdin-producing heme oxygenase [unclassified Cyanobium]MCP9857501.1 biliverdin-producing heme oxygenase [Cyanobium sp. Cruz-8H5]MCP9864927.1 biliverdin-producing heme oxygenase [Cyanobium sp. Cruz-8D1]